MSPSKHVAGFTSRRLDIASDVVGQHLGVAAIDAVKDVPRHLPV
jgi:hypothetical protein